MPKIVFFNLADMHKDGLVKTSVESLRRKYPRSRGCFSCFFEGPNRVDSVDLFQLMEDPVWRRTVGLGPVPMSMEAPSLPSALALPSSSMSASSSAPLLSPEASAEMERHTIMQLCDAADKLMLGIHGHYDDTDQGFKGLGWDMGSGVAGTADQFASLVAGFLRPRRAYKFSLIVCFGARSERFRANHDGAFDPADIRGSFAFKFYKKLIEASGANVTMTARTGAVKFDSATGRSLVQTEASVDALIEYDRLQASPDITHVRDVRAAIERRMMEGGRESMAAFWDMDERMSQEGAVPTSQEEAMLKRFHDIQRRATALQSRMDENYSSKYGKFVYTSDGVSVRVFRKYEDGVKVMRLLYEGALAAPVVSSTPVSLSSSPPVTLSSGGASPSHSSTSSSGPPSLL